MKKKKEREIERAAVAKTSETSKHTCTHTLARSL